MPSEAIGFPPSFVLREKISATTDFVQSSQKINLNLLYFSLAQYIFPGGLQLNVLQNRR